MEQDVMIVGAGAAGLTAAIASAEAGARTVVVEKAPNIKKSNTSLSGGNITVGKIREETKQGRESLLSPREFVQEALILASGQADPALVLTWAQNIGNTVEWLTELGLKWERTRFLSHKAVRNTVFGRGAGLNKQLLSLAYSKGVEVLFNTRGMKLLTDVDGKIKGIRCQTETGIKDFESRAVVLAASGFQANKDMLRSYFGPEFAKNAKLTGSTFSTGDGHVMAEEVGAQLINMNSFHGTSSIGKHFFHPLIQTHGFFRDSILVNRMGQRFIDESLHGDSVSCAIMAQPGQEAALIFDEGVKTKYSEEVTRPRLTGVIMKFNTIEELSKGIGVSYDELLKTLKEFNEAVAKGKATHLDIPRSENVVRLDTPPFYTIYPIWCGLHCTLGGPKLTPKTEVVNSANIPIPGLFACGEMAGGFYFGKFYSTPGGTKSYMGNYFATTASLSTCVVFGRIAGIEAAKLREQKGSFYG